MKLWRAVVSVFLVGGAPLGAQATEAPVAAPAPLQEKALGYTFVLKDWRFALPDTFLRRPNPFNKKPPSFVARYRILDAKGLPMNLMDWCYGKTGSSHDSHLQVRLLSPDGMPVEGSISEQGIEAAGVNPDWEFVNLELFGRDIKADDGLTMAEANGEITETLALDSVKLEAGQTVTLNQPLKTKLGSVLTIESAKLVPNGQGGTVTWEVSWSVPVDAPEARLSAGAAYIVDEAGKRVITGSSSTAGASHSTITVDFPTLPTGEKWPWRFELAQSVPARAVKTGRFKVNFKVPLLDKELHEGDFDPNSQVTLAQNQSVFARIEEDGLPHPTRWSAKLGLKSVEDGDFSQWVARSPKFFQGNTELKGWAYGQSSQEFWHRDGTRTLPGERISSVVAQFDPNNRPTSLRIVLELEKSVTLDTPFSLEVPIPAPGKTRTVDEELANAPLTLAAVIHYNSLDEVPGTKSKGTIPSRGLALVFKAQPQVAGAFYLNFRSARDDAGRSLESLPDPVQNYDARRPDARGFYTLYLPSPAPDAASITIDAATFEAGPVTKTTKLEIPDVPVSPLGK